MSGKNIYGLESLLPQPDFKVVSSSDGGANGSQSFLILRDDFQQAAQIGTFSRGVTATSLDPNTQSRGGDALYLDRIETADQQEGWLRVNVYYSGWSASYQTGGSEREEQPTYSKRSVLVQRSILEHPEVLALSEEDRASCRGILMGQDSWDFIDGKLKYRYVDSSGVERFEDSTNQPSLASQPWVKQITQGITTFDAAYTTWAKTWSDDVGIPQSQQDLQGKVLPGAVPGNPYTPAGHDWRLDEVSETQTGVVNGQSGGLYRNRLLFVLSQPGGWNATLYDY